MYCEPANCYCAEILGDINKFPIDDKIYYIRPENIKIVDKSFQCMLKNVFFRKRIQINWYLKKIFGLLM